MFVSSPNLPPLLAIHMMREPCLLKWWYYSGSFPGGLVVENSPAKQDMWMWSLSWEDPLEKEMATHFSIPAWEIPWMEEPDGLQSMGLQKSHKKKSCV